MRDPGPIYKRLRDEAPAYYCERWDCWALSRFADIWKASGDVKHFTAAQGTTSAHLLTKVQPVTPMLNLMDPPSTRSCAPPCAATSPRPRSRRSSP